MDIGACGSVLIDLGNTKHCTILAYTILSITRNLRDGCLMVAEGLVGCNSDGLVWSPDALGTTAQGATIRTVVGRYEVVHTVDLIHVMPFANTTALRDDDTVSTFHGTTHIGLQFRTMHFPILMDGIDLTIIVEEYAEVVYVTLHIVVLPRPTDIF